jgi:glycosyltransferase involved in cell wall biosynthesis
MSGNVVIDARMIGVTGIGTYLTHVLPRVTALWQDARFTLLGEPQALDALAGERVEVRRFDAPIYSVHEQVGLARVIPPKPALVWSPHYNIPLLYKGPLAVTVHDVIHLVMPPSPLKHAYARAMFAQVRRRASVILCNSQFTANDFQARVGPPRAMVVTPLGVDDEWFSLPQAPHATPPFLLYVGNVKPHKNLSRLVDAFARVLDRIPHRLMIVGPRENLLTADDDVVARAEALGDRVQFTGRLDRATLEQFVARCDGVVLPSLYEGFGLPALEALAAGRRVAAALGTALPETCGPHATYFDPYDVDAIADALVTLATPEPDDGTAERRTWARRFQWNDCARRTVDALRAVTRARMAIP